MATVNHIGLFPQCLPSQNPNFNSQVSEENYTFFYSAFKSNTIAGGVGFYWRVKKFRFNISGSSKITYDGGEFIDTFNGYVEFERAGRNGQEQVTGADLTEKYFVCDEMEWKINAVGDFSLADSSNFGGLIKPSWIDNTDNKVCFLQPLYFSSIGSDTRLLFIIVLTNNNDNGSVPAPFTEDYGDPIVQPQEYTLDFGNDIKLETLKWTYPPVIGPDALGVTYYYNYDTFNLEVTEWWGYDPDDGNGPIYNTTTGERIRFDI